MRKVTQQTWVDSGEGERQTFSANREPLQLDPDSHLDHSAKEVQLGPVTGGLTLARNLIVNPWRISRRMV